jgi:hypothetical protein
MSSLHLYTQIVKAIEYKRKILKIDGKAPPSIFNTWNERAEYIKNLPKSESEKVDMLKKIVFEMNMNMYI